MMIQVEDLTFSFRQGSPIFSSFDWEVARRDRWSVLGPSGCGKTTMLYLLAGLLAPDGGRIAIDGALVNRPRPRTGLILQDYGLLPWATVRENASLGLRVRRFYGPDGRHAPIDFHVPDPAAHVDGWLDRVGLSSVADHYPGQVSGGQRQRAAIARTLVLEPDVLLMDEPFSSLDAPTRENLQELTVRLCEEGGITLIIVTHSIEEAVILGRKILLLDHPPNTNARIIDNPGAGRADFRESQDYYRLCQKLRRELAV